jgi:hypothetical protein
VRPPKGLPTIGPPLFTTDRYGRHDVVCVDTSRFSIRLGWTAGGSHTAASHPDSPFSIEDRRHRTRMNDRCILVQEYQRMAQDVQFNNFVFGIALALMLGYILFIGRPILVPVVTAILLVYVIVGVSRLSGYIPFVGKRIPSQVRYILAALVIALLTIELFALFVANLTAIVARAPEFQESLLNTLQQGAALIGIESTLTWETVRREVLGEFNLQGMIRTGFVSIAGLLGSLLFVLLNVAFLLMEQRTLPAQAGPPVRRPEQNPPPAVGHRRHQCPRRPLPRGEDDDQHRARRDQLADHGDDGA